MNQAAQRILFDRKSHNGVFLKQFYPFGNKKRNKVENRSHQNEINNMPEKRFDN